MPHTPPPWLQFDEEGYSWIGVAVHGETGATEIAKVYDRDDAKLILNAVNCHAKLLAALEEARTGLLWYMTEFPQKVDGSDQEAMQRIDAAIAEAEEAAGRGTTS